MTRGRPRGRRVPGGIAVLAALGVAFVVLPLIGLLVNVPWSTAARRVGSSGIRDAIVLSVVCPLGATALAAVLGVPVAWALARGRFRGRSALRALIMLPMVLPPVVGGVALLYAFGRGGLVGGPLFRLMGLSLPYTTAGVMVASAFVSMPFLVLSVEAGFRQLGERYEEAASTLGAGRFAVLRHVTLPLLRPSLAAGATLCWARSLGELGATITFAGDLPGTTQTTPLAVFLALQTDPRDAIVLSLVLFLLSVAALLVLRRAAVAVR